VVARARCDRRVTSNEDIPSKILREIIVSARYELPDAAGSPDASRRVRIRLPDGTRAEVLFFKLK
jgi:hypothetical protein